MVVVNLAGLRITVYKVRCAMFLSSKSLKKRPGSIVDAAWLFPLWVP